MTSEEKLAEAQAEFFRCTKSGIVPHDLMIRTTRSWNGRALEPVPCEHYVVEYCDGAHEIDRLLRENPSREKLQQSLSFVLDEQSKRVKVGRK